jgi:hypothetical protein
MRTRWILIAALLLFTLVATAVLVTRGYEISGYLHAEVFKLLAQLVIVAGVGGVATLVLNELNASRDRREANRTLLRATLNELVGSYNDIKAVRRRLRAQAIRPDPDNANAYVLRDTYDSLLQCLNESQLKLEAHVRLIDKNRPQYPDAEQLLRSLGDAESYLGNIIKEWEHRLGGFKEPQDQNRLADFDGLRCFVADALQSFKPGFAVPLENVFHILGRALSR